MENNTVSIPIDKIDIVDKALSNLYSNMEQLTHSDIDDSIMEDICAIRELINQPPKKKITIKHLSTKTLEEKTI